ncbi:hypothetical protein [Staphylococcus phage PMBT9]|nr:hypothetical protein [Staphylococcus phage PMBT9]
MKITIKVRKTNKKERIQGIIAWSIIILVTIILIKGGL